MKQTKIVCIIMIVLIIGILVWQLVILNADKTPQFIPSGPTNTEENKDTLDKQNEKYNMKIVESNNKEYVMLVVETNLFDGSEKLTIEYDNNKYLLNTANPLLENVEIQKGKSTNVFKVNVESLENYTIIFIKKAIQQNVEAKDIVIN